MSSRPESVEVLHVGTDRALVEAAVSGLSGDWTVTAREGVERARPALAGGDVDVLVCESGVGGDRLGFLRTVAEEHEAVPSVVLTREDGVASEALAAGATDVVVDRDAVETDALLGRRLENVRGRADAGAGAAAELAAERAFSDLLLDTLEDVFYLIDTDGRLLRWNDALNEVTGYTDAELAGMDALEFFPPEDREAVAAGIEETIARGRATVEASMLTGDGEEVPFEFNGGLLTDGDDVRGIVGVGRDLSEREALETELREQATLLDHVFGQVPVALYVKDTEGRHVRMSDRAGNPEEMVGKTDPEIYDSRLAEESYADDMRVIEAGEPLINKEEYNPQTGEWTLTSKVPWRGEDGTVRGLIGATRRITEKKEYERQLKLRNRAMEAAPIGITIHDAGDAGYPITYANAGFQRLTGYGTSWADGRALSALAGADTDPDALATVQDAFEAGEAASAVVVLYRRRGQPFWARVSVAPVTDDSGETTHFVGFLQDVTDTKEHAEEIERRLDEFGELLAREVRTPLGEAEETLRTLEESDAPAAVETARREVQRVDKLLEDLAAVHSFSVTSREVFGPLEADGGDT